MPLGCYNRLPQTGWLINNSCHSSGGWKSEISVPAWWVGAFFWGTDVLWCPRVVGGVRDLSETFYKGTNLIHEGSILMTCDLPEIPPPNTITMGY